MDDVSGGGILHATDLCEDGRMIVRECLAAKHPSGQPVVPSKVVCTSQKSEFPHPIIFEPLTGSLIKFIAISIEGALGPLRLMPLTGNDFVPDLKEHRMTSVIR